MTAPTRLVATSPGRAPDVPRGKHHRRACVRCGYRRQVREGRNGELCGDCSYVLDPTERRYWNEKEEGK